jgi:hypothetical protein
MKELFRRLTCLNFLLRPQQRRYIGLPSSNTGMHNKATTTNTYCIRSWPSNINSWQPTPVGGELLKSIMLMNRIRTEGAHDGPYLMMSTGNNATAVLSFHHISVIILALTQGGLPSFLRHVQPLFSQNVSEIFLSSHSASTHISPCHQQMAVLCSSVGFYRSETHFIYQYNYKAFKIRPFCNHSAI